MSVVVEVEVEVEAEVEVEVEEDAVVEGEEEEVVEVEVEEAAEEEGVEEDSRGLCLLQDRRVVGLLEAAGLSVNLLDEEEEEEEEGEAGEELHPLPQGHRLSLLSLSPLKDLHRVHRPRRRLLLNLLNVSMKLSYLSLVILSRNLCRNFLLVLVMAHWVRKSNFSQTITGYPISPTRKFINTLLLFLQGTVTLLPGAWQTPFGKVQKSKPR
jgi:hypothetical protein